MRFFRRRGPKPPVSVPQATFTLFPGQSGRLRAIDGLDDVADLPEVVRAVPAVRRAI